MTRIYVAGPYTVGDVAVNVRQAILAGNALFGAGYAPYIPHLTHFWHVVAPHPYEDWMALDLVFLETCAALVRLPGPSRGADVEVAHAHRLGIPVYPSVQAFLVAQEHVAWTVEP